MIIGISPSGRTLEKFYFSDFELHKEPHFVNQWFLTFFFPSTPLQISVQFSAPDIKISLVEYRKVNDASQLMSSVYAFWHNSNVIHRK